MEIINDPVRAWAFDIHDREKARFTFVDGSYLEVSWSEQGDGGIEVVSNRHRVTVRTRSGNVIEVGQKKLSDGVPDSINTRRKR